MTNIKALAEFLSIVSGRSAGSLRTKIISQKKTGYESKEVKQEIRKLADMIESISPEKADMIRRNAEID